jgi:hypothetical protein
MATDFAGVGKMVMRAPVWTWLLLPVILVGGWYMATHGYESRRVKSAAFSRTSSGYSFGCHRLFGFKGQTISIDYDVTAMPRGHFKISVLRPLKSLSEGPVLYRTIQQLGSGQLEVELPATGFYTIGCDGSPDGNGYDVTYEASWRVG